MAFRLSDRDRAASQAAAAIRQANRAQADYNQRMGQAQANLSQAQSRPMGGLESVLAGIGEKFNDWGSTIGNIGRTVIGGVSEPFRKAETDRIISDDSARRNEIAKKYGYNSYSEAMNDDNASQDFWNEIRNASESTQQRLANKVESDRNSLGNVRDIDLNTAKGQALSTASDVLQILGPVGNVVGGVTEGIGGSYKGAAGGTDADVWGGDNLGRTLGNAAIGGVTAFVGDRVAGKLASKAPGNSLISKAARSNIGRGTITGAAAGATGGGLGAALNGGDVIGGTLQGALDGALSGGTMAGTMGLIGSGIDKLNNKFNRPDVSLELQTAANRAAREAANDIIETPTARTLEDALQMPSKSMVDDVTEMYTNPQTRKVYVQDASDNGPVTVNRKARNQYRLPDRSGSTLDGILGPNNKIQLPNAEKPTYKKDATAVMQSGKVDDPISLLQRMGVSDDTINAVKDAARDYQNNVAGAALQAYGLDNKTELPYLNREQYYRDNAGQLAAKGGNGNVSAEDVDDYMYNHLRSSAGNNSLGRNQDDNWTILREFLGDRAENMSLDDMYDEYRMLARSASMANSDTYTPNNVAGGLYMDDALNKRLSQEMYDRLYPATKIDVESQAPLSQRVDVNASTPNRGRLIQDVMPAQRRQAQPQVQAQPIQEAPVQAPVQRVRRAADTSDIKINPNLAPEDVARLERQLTVSRQKQGAALLEQYGTLDAPVRRAIGSPEDVLTTLYDDYGLKTPADVQYAANHVTGRNGVVSQMTRELAASANNVDTTIAKDWLNDLMDANGLLDDEQKTVTKQIAGALKRANSSSDGATTLDIMKQLEKQSARYKGKDGTYHHATEAETRKGIILDLVHDELQDRLWDAAGDPKKVLTPKRITELKSMYKDNDAWANFIDNRLAKSTSGAELRSAMKPLVDGSKIVYGSKQSAGGFADRAYKAATSANHIVAMGQMAYDAALGSDKVKQIRASRYAKDAAKAKAQLTGQDMPKGNGLIGAAKNIGQKAVNKAGKAAEMLNNETVTGSALGRFATMAGNRRIGQGEAQAVENRAALQDATQQMQDIQSNYDNAMAQAQQMYSQAQQTQNSILSTLDRIGAGMERALAAGDINAYSQLADLYKQAYNIYGLQNPTQTQKQAGAKSLSTSQSKALTGLQQLQTLSGMSPDLGTALASSPLGGAVNMLGGNDYANQAEALATTIGYLLSGANIKPDEAEALGRGYVPSAFDSEQVRQKKLSRAEQLLRNYLADTSALQ